MKIFYTIIDAIQPKFSIREESSRAIYTIAIHLKNLETCYFDLSNFDEAVKLTESLDALIAYTGKQKSTYVCCCCNILFRRLDM